MEQLPPIRPVLVREPCQLPRLDPRSATQGYADSGRCPRLGRFVDEQASAGEIRSYSPL